MKAVKLVATILLISLCLITPLPVLGTDPAINGQMDASEPWVHWFSDQTWEFKGYPHNQQPGNTLGFDAYYFYANSKLYLFISTDDNTAENFNRDKFTVYFDIFPYGLGPEDVPYSIEAPTLLYDEGSKLRGPSWSNIRSYEQISTDSIAGQRTFEVAIPLNDIVPNVNNVNYRTAKMMIYLENYGEYLWAQHKVVNYHPDQANGNNYWKNPNKWEQIDLTTLCPGYFHIQPPQYGLTLNTVGDGSIVSEPNQAAYVSGTTVQLTAEPDEGWQFAGWSGDAVGTGNTTSIVMNGNKAVTATFTQIEYTLDVTSIGAGCSVTKSPSKATYHYGEVVTLTPIAVTGYEFSNWMGHLIGNNSPATITMNESKLVIANFVQTNYTLGINYAGTGTGQVVTNSTNYYYGDVVALMAIPDVGSEFTSWSGSLTGNTNPAYLTIDGNKAVTATFTKQTSTLTVNTVGSGVVTKTPSLTAYYYGTNVQLTATPAAGWSFAGWSGDLTSNMNPATINMAGNMTVYATFTQDQYPLILETSGQGNPTITPNTAVTYGSTVQLNANPLAGWAFTGWSSNTQDITIADPSQPATTAVIKGAGTITAVYSQNTYVLMLNHLTGGTITVDNNLGSYFDGYHYGDTVTLTAIPDEGYTFLRWSGDAEGTGTTCTITIDGNKLVGAIFTQPDYEIIVTIDPSAGGSVLVEPPDIYNFGYHYGDVVTLTAQPNAGYYFSGWSGDASGTVQSIQLTVTGDIALTAHFVQNEYQLIVNVIGEGTATKSLEGPYHYGDNVTLSAHPATGWSFANWTGSTSSTTNSITLTIYGNITLNAFFNQNYYTLDVSGSTGGHLILTPDQATYTYGTHVHIEAVADLGWDFDRFSWFEADGPVMSSSSSTIDLIINCSTTIWPHYSRQECYLTLINTGNGSGTISGYQSLFYSLYGYYYYGTEITLIATPGAYSVFAGWGQDLTSTDNPVTFTLTGNTTVTANFITSQKSPLLHLTPDTIVGPEPDIGDRFDLELRVENVSDLWIWAVDLKWNPAVIQLVDVHEGPFLCSVGETLFVAPAIESQSPRGLLNGTTGVFFNLSDKISGSGVLATFTFQVLNYGNSEIEFTKTVLCQTPFIFNYFDFSEVPIPHLVAGATFTLNPPPSGGPTARFSLPNDDMCYVGDLLVLEASKSLPGFDALPVGHATTNPITSYVWSIDFGNDGTVDLTVEGANATAVIPQIGVSSITLTVTALDVYAPTSPDYNQNKHPYKSNHR